MSQLYKVWLSLPWLLSCSCLQEAAALYKQKYAEQIRADQELHDQIAAQRTEMRYRRHYDMCAEIVQSIVDFAVKVAEYREITNKLVFFGSSVQFYFTLLL